MCQSKKATRYEVVRLGYDAKARPWKLSLSLRLCPP